MNHGWRRISPLLALLTGVVVCGCAPSIDARIDIAGYPACYPGNGGDLVSEDRAELTVKIDVEDLRQEMLGFGASDCWSIQYVGQWPVATREAIADLLFEHGLDGTNDPRGIGLSVWRFNIGAFASFAADRVIDIPARSIVTLIGKDQNREG